MENLVSFGSLGDDALIWRATALNKTVNRYMNMKLIWCWGNGIADVPEFGEKKGINWSETLYLIIIRIKTKKHLLTKHFLLSLQQIFCVNNEKMF